MFGRFMDAIMDVVWSDIERKFDPFDRQAKPMRSLYQPNETSTKKGKNPGLRHIKDTSKHKVWSTASFSPFLYIRWVIIPELKYVSKCVALIARSAITLLIDVILWISCLKSHLVLKNKISNHYLNENIIFNVEKNVKENLRLFKKHFFLQKN